MKIYNYDKDSKVFLSTGDAQRNPKRKGEYLYPKFSTTIVPPEVTKNEVAVFMGDYWKVVPDYRNQEQINMETHELSQVTKIGELDSGYMLYSDYLESDLYEAHIQEQTVKDDYYNLLDEMSILDEKRIRALCEPSVKDSATGETWLDYYNNQMELLRQKLQEVNYGA